MNWKAIKVTMLQRSVPDRDAIRAWVREFSGCEKHVLPADATDMELLPAYAAKRCYMSFEPNAANPNVTKVRRSLADFFSNVLASKHGCYDAETDVLTSEGWKSWPTVTMQDSLATRRSDGVIEYHRPRSLLRGVAYAGRMYRVDSRNVDLLVTPNHKMLSVLTTTCEGRRRNESSYALMSADGLGTRSHAYIKTGHWCPGDAAEVDSDVLALLGFTIGDGCVVSNKIEFHLHRERKISWLQQVVSRLGWAFRTRDDRFFVTVPAAYLGLFSAVYDDERQKQIPSGVLCNYNRCALTALYDGLIQSDGCVQPTSVSFDSTSHKLIGQFQHLCLHVGLAADIGYTIDDRSSSYGDLPLTRAHVIRRCTKPEVNRWAGQRGHTAWVDSWEGLVYCAEVPNSTLYVRRNGKVVWSGNSVLEHSSYTFAIEGVTRVFAAEMNRHRAGVAISEGSMRFILQRIKNGIDVWMPLSIAPNVQDSSEAQAKKEKTRQAFELVFDTIAGVYDELAKLWEIEKLPMAEKKKITSMLRRILPMGCCTGGVWTMNVRAMRHIITMRTSPAAEEEIAYVFRGIARELVRTEPNLFGDFHEEDAAWVPTHDKV